MMSRSSTYRSNSDNGGCPVQPDGEVSVVALFPFDHSHGSDRALMSQILLFIQSEKRRITEAWTARNRRVITSKGAANYG